MATHLSPQPSPPSSLPSDERLADIAVEAERTGWAVEMYDAQWRLAWVSTELKALLDEEDSEKLGYGRHIAEVYQLDPWSRSVTDDSKNLTWLDQVPKMFEHTPGGLEGLKQVFPKDLHSALETVDPVPTPLLWTSHIELVQGELEPSRVVFVTAKIHDDLGELLGFIRVYGSSLPARVLALVARGNQGMFKRMAALVEPGRRRAAVLFADLQSSGALSRKLPSAAYFKLIRHLTSTIDEVVIERKGIVGKHAGDGITSFFLADDAGSDSGAARMAIEAARGIVECARDTAACLGRDSDLIGPDDCLFNVGVHWGGALYMGQVVTGGRLEITALGDEVNECARMQQSARDGAVLASKALLERLTPEDAGELRIDADRVLYHTVADLPTADEKAVRDAGGVPVTAL